MAGERMTVSFDEGERQALSALTEESGLAEVFRARAARLRHRVPVGGMSVQVEDLGDSLSDVVRAVVRIGLDAIDRQYTALQYRAAVSTLSEVFEDEGMAALSEASTRSLAAVSADALPLEPAPGTRAR